MNDYCYYRLNLDTKDALNPSWKFPEPVNGYGIYYPKAYEIFSKDWLSYASSKGIDFTHALLFYRGPGLTSKEAHVDTHHTSHKFVNSAINWVIGGANSKMNWYKLPDMSVATTVKDPKTRVPYTTFQFKDLEWIESCEIADQVTLVKTCVPHGITMDVEPRWCISARVNLNKDVPWDQTVEYLRSKNLLIERT